MKVFISTNENGLSLGYDLLEIYNRISNKFLKLSELYEIPRHDDNIIKAIEKIKSDNVDDDPYDDLEILNLDIDDPGDYYITEINGIDKIHINYNNFVDKLSKLDNLSGNTNKMSNVLQEMIQTAKKIDNSDNTIHKYLSVIPAENIDEHDCQEDFE